MDASTLFQKAQAAARRGNVEEALEAWQQALAQTPRNLAERKKLREFELKHVKGSGGGLLSRGLSSLRMKASGNPRDMIVQAEKALASNPKDAAALGAVGLAAGQLGDHETAFWSFQSAVEADANNGDFWKGVAIAAKALHKPDIALNAFRKALAINPKDYEADKGIREAQSAKVMTSMAYSDIRSGKADQEAARAAGDILRQQLAVERGEATEEDAPPSGAPQKAEAAPPPQAPAGQAKYRMADLMEPGNVFDPEERRRQLEIYENLLEQEPREEDRLHLKRRRLESLMIWEEHELAEMCCNELIETDPNDPYAAKALAGIQEARLKAKLEELKASGAAEDEIKAAEVEFSDFAIEQARRNVETRPSDGSLRVHLGRLLFDKERYDEAAAAFQGALTDQKLAPDGLYWLGRCFYKLKLPHIAERAFRNALQRLESPRSDLAKQIRYTLGQQREEDGDLKGAFEEYSALFEVDVTFQDILDRVFALRDRLAAKGEPPPPEKKA